MNCSTALPVVHFVDKCHGSPLSERSVPRWDQVWWYKQEQIVFIQLRDINIGKQNKLFKKICSRLTSESALFLQASTCSAAKKKLVTPSIQPCKVAVSVISFHEADRLLSHFLWPGCTWATRLWSCYEGSWKNHWDKRRPQRTCRSSWGAHSLCTWVVRANNRRSDYAKFPVE